MDIDDGAPTGGDGLERAFEFVLPSVGVLIAVVLTKEFVGGMATGLIYLLLWGFILAGTYTSAKNWNIPYTESFVIAAIILWVMMPGIISKIVHPVFGVLGTLLGAVFLAVMAALLIDKAGLDELLNEL